MLLGRNVKDAATASSQAKLGTYTLLQFGDDASIGGPPGALIRTTPLIPNVTQYAVRVMGISVCAKRLHINPEVFRMRSDHTGGFVFDTGLPYTILVHTTYTAVRAELVQYFTDMYGLHPRPPQPGSLTCAMTCHMVIMDFHL
ncbi:uncharacterized protein LOC115729921 [Rhodamnia argentea]|uniref:Uncharacterized protein LOC115729921 n=1 Tax=Rhodamnia argentea TaxID=178133 RepID=A0A8B8N2X9_9MYRT|nr:uncharacterized protein LOC115729921 [Rhodamnia argentea]